MLSQKIRRQFLDYFKDKNHSVIPSSPVFPHDDPTLLFINAGMNQFKDIFLGKSHRDYTRATTSQKCIRVGGKHNDLENVGHTSRHLTFFEMLGNFSFGDYFKKEAIQYSWEVSTRIFGFDPERIWPTVFLDDNEAFELWTQYVPAERITRFGEKENFWMMGDVGPCGPCSELLYDRGPDYGSGSNPLKDPSGNRFLEYWNLVFMQYNRQPSGQMNHLPKPSIDTGAGLERVLSLKMGVDSVFETDVLRGIISKIEQLSGIEYRLLEPRSSAFRVIADHLRCLAFAIADGVQPSNIDRGYVLRKVLRRAVRYGRQLGIEKSFMAGILPPLIISMGEDYPELIKGQERIAEILTVEEEAFSRTLKRGGNILNQVIEKAHSFDKKITGEEAFKLKDTYGLPFEEIVLIAKDTDLTIDHDRYLELEMEAKQRSRQTQKGLHQSVSDNIYADLLSEYGENKFLGYTQAASESKVIGLVLDGQFTEVLNEGEEGSVFLNETPFYGEMGGQVGDEGVLEGTHRFFEVQDCNIPYKGLIAHKGILKTGVLRVGDNMTARIDRDRRRKIADNHTATHLLHWALHQILGEHIKQAGSVVDTQRLRFDFSHHKALTFSEIRQIENLINEKIRENIDVNSYEMKFDEVQDLAEIKQFFGEKYGSIVRVVDIDYSKELCGGTHTHALGNIGLFRIAKESSIASGIRRIEAVTGREAEELNRRDEDTLLEMAAELKIPAFQLKERVQKLVEENKNLTHELKNIKKEQLNRLVERLILQQEKSGSFDLIIAEVSATTEELKYCLDRICEKTKIGIVILAATFSDKCQIMVRVSDAYVPLGVSALEILKKIMSMVEGSGGGKATMAQGGGKAPGKIQEAFAAVREYLTDHQT